TTLFPTRRSSDLTDLLRNWLTNRTHLRLRSDSGRAVGFLIHPIDFAPKVHEFTQFLRCRNLDAPRRRLDVTSRRWDRRVHRELWEHHVQARVGGTGY